MRGLLRSDMTGKFFEVLRLTLADFMPGEARSPGRTSQATLTPFKPLQVGEGLGSKSLGMPLNCRQTVPAG